MDPVSLPSAPSLERRVLQVVAVATVLLVVVFGGYVTAGALSTATGPPVDVAGIVRVTPLSGWEVAGRSGDPPAARLTRGSANLDLVAIAFTGSRDDLARGYVDEILRPGAEQLSVSRLERVTLDSGIEGTRFSYIGTFGDVQTPVEGEVTAVVSPSGVGVVFDGWAPFGLLQYAVDDVETMIANAEVS